MRRLLSTFVRLFALRREIEQLKDERVELRALVVEAVERYRPADMAPLFPREEPLFDASDAHLL